MGSRRSQAHQAVRTNAGPFRSGGSRARPRKRFSQDAGISVPGERSDIERDDAPGSKRRRLAGAPASTPSAGPLSADVVAETVGLRNGLEGMRMKTPRSGSSSGPTSTSPLLRADAHIPAKRVKIDVTRL